jgi:PmbA protein
VQEITIAGNMKNILGQILAIGTDTLVRGTKKTGSILVESMTVAGS